MVKLRDTYFKTMKFLFTKAGYRNGKAIYLLIGKLQLCIAKHQFAFWVNYKAIWDLRY